MSANLERNFSGSALDSLGHFYRALKKVPRSAWPEMMHGMGYNFEFYDALFALVVANVQLSFGEGDYTPRHEAMQAALLPFCSEFGIELGHGLQQSHRRLYAEFFRAASGVEMPERYPRGDTNPWLACARRWAERMRARLEVAGSSVDRARYGLGYLWAVEHLSVREFDIMRAAWHEAGVFAPYLDAHCAVEEEHDAHATRALLAFASPDDPLVIAAIKAHEEDLSGYYAELARLVEPH